MSDIYNDTTTHNAIIEGLAKELGIKCIPLTENWYQLQNSISTIVKIENDQLIIVIYGIYSWQCDLVNLNLLEQLRTQLINRGFNL